MQTVTYIIHLPRIGEKVVIDVLPEGKFTVNYIETHNPTDSVVIINDDTGELSRLVITNGKWQVNYFAHPHNINFIELPRIHTTINQTATINQTTETRIIETMVMNRVPDNEIKIGDYGIYTERRSFENGPKGEILNVPKEHVFIINSDEGKAMGRYGGRRFGILFQADLFTPFDKSGKPMRIGTIAETKSGYRLYRGEGVLPLKGEHIQFYRPVTGISISPF